MASPGELEAVNPRPQRLWEHANLLDETPVNNVLNLAKA